MPKNLLDAFLRHTEVSTRQESRRSSCGTARSLPSTWLQLAKTVVEASKRIETLREARPSSRPRIVHGSHNGLADIVARVSLPTLGSGRSAHRPSSRRSPQSVTFEIGLTEYGLIPSNCERLVGSRWRVAVSGTTADSAMAALQLAQHSQSVKAPALILWTSGTTGDPEGSRAVKPKPLRQCGRQTLGRSSIP